MKSDRERDGLLGRVHTVVCIPDPKRIIWATCPILESIYDHDGWLQEQIFADADGSTSGRRVHRLNPRTGNVEVENLDKAGKPTGIRTVVTCDEASSTLTEETFAVSGSAGRRVLTFDTQGNVKLEESFHGNGSLNSGLAYRYDEHERPSETIWDDAHSVAPGRTTFRYDARGVLVEQDWYSKAGVRYAKDLFTYKFHSHGNWVERSTRLCSPPPEKAGDFVCGAPTTEWRWITYYED